MVTCPSCKQRDRLVVYFDQGDCYISCLRCEIDLLIYCTRCHSDDIIIFSDYNGELYFSCERCKSTGLL